MTSPEIDEFDKVLDLEHDSYMAGFQEGQAHASREQTIEGKIYGYQTGFQRTLIIGYIQGLIDVWMSNLPKYESNKSFVNHLSATQSILDSVRYTNDDAAVEQFELKMRKARNKLRLMANLVGESWKIIGLDKLVALIAGQTSSTTISDESW